MKITQNKHIKLFIFLSTFFSLTAFSGIVCAETQYVSDQLIITLRGGPGNEYRIIRTLRTGTPLEVIEEGERHLKVRTEGGDEGWVLKQYITGETPKPVIIAELKEKIDRLNTSIEQYKKDMESLRDELEKAGSDHEKEIRDLRQTLSQNRGTVEQTAGELEEVTAKYNALVRDSKDVVNIVKERDSLKEANSRLQDNVEQLRIRNDKLRRSQMIWWFAAGGGVFFVGWITGKVSRQKRFY